MSTQRHRGTERVERTRGSVSAGAPCVLVGTYWPEQMQEWVLPKGYYNYPIRAKAEETIPVERLAQIKELWLYNHKKGRKCFSAEFVRVATKGDPEFAGYPTGTKQHGAGGKYFLFKVTPLDRPSAAMRHAPVVVRLADFAHDDDLKAGIRKVYLGVKATDEEKSQFLGRLLPADVCKCGCKRLKTFPKAVQLDFLDVLDDMEALRCKFDSVRSSGRYVKFIDLFAGIGGIRKGFEQACRSLGIKSRCVFTSEIKPHAIAVLKQNNPSDYIHGDITKVQGKDIPDFDILLGGFPCQAFSAAGRRMGFEDTRGTLFFDVARLIKTKQPFGFILENVEGLVNHDRQDSKAPYGRTLSVILSTLEELGYKVSWRVLNAKDFGVPQDRRRIYIVGTRKAAPDLDAFPVKKATVGTVLEHGLPTSTSPFVKRLLSHFPISELPGKSIKDKRGGNNNIHSWDIEFKGPVSSVQRDLLNRLLRERRKHQWAKEYGIDWMDGMPLTLDMIRTFFDHPELEQMLEDLSEKGYVVKERPKRKILRGKVFVREQDESLPVGYNIVAGKMSFEVNKILAPEEIAPTLVAMDMQHLYVVDGKGLRPLSLREGLGMFGYPPDFKFSISSEQGYDLLGNTVVVPVIKAVAARLLDIYRKVKRT